MNKASGCWRPVVDLVLGPNLGYSGVLGKPVKPL